MLVIRGLRVMVAPKSFECFDNMFRSIDPQGYNATYIAVMVYDKVALEGDPMRANQANTWLNGAWYPRLHCDVVARDNDRNIDYIED